VRTIVRRVQLVCRCWQQEKELLRMAALRAVDKSHIGGRRGAVRMARFGAWSRPEGGLS
jgi:hypothetical protein